MQKRNPDSPSMRTRFLSMFTGLLSARVISLILYAPMLVLLARSLEPSMFAKVSGILGIAAFLAAAGDLGLSASVTRETARGHARNVHGLNRLNRWSAGSLAAIGLTAILMGYAMAGDPWLLQLTPLAAWLGAERLADNVVALHIGERRSLPAAISVALRKAGPLIGVAAAMFLDDTYVVLGLSLGHLAGSLLALAVVRRPDLDEAPGSKPSLRGALRQSAPFWLNSAAAQTRQLDIVLVGAFGTPEAAIAYAPASRLISPLRLIPTTIAQAALPFVAKAGGKGLRVPALVVGVTAISFLLFGSLFVLAGPVVTVLFGLDYLSTLPVLRVLLAGLTLAALVSIMTSVAQGLGAERRVGLVNSIAAIVTLAAISIGALLAGAVGAAGGIIMVYGLQAAALVHLVVRVQRRQVPSE